MTFQLFEIGDDITISGGFHLLNNTYNSVRKCLIFYLGYLLVEVFGKRSFHSSVILLSVFITSSRLAYPLWRPSSMSLRRAVSARRSDSSSSRAWGLRKSTALLVLESVLKSSSRFRPILLRSSIVIICFIEYTFSVQITKV